MFAIIALLSVGVGLVLGGVTYTWFMGYNAFVADLWIQALSLMWNSPSTIINEAINGQTQLNESLGGKTQGLFQGVLIVAAGIVLMLGSTIAFLVRSLTKDLNITKRSGAKVSIRRPWKTRTSANAVSAGSTKPEDDTEFSDGPLLKPVLEKGPSTLSKIQDRLKASKRADEFSESLVEEDDSKSQQKASWSARIFSKRAPAMEADRPEDSQPHNENSWGDVSPQEQKGIQATLEGGTMIATRRKARGKGTSRIKLQDAKTGSLGAAVQAALDKVWDSALGAIASRMAKKNTEDNDLRDRENDDTTMSESTVDDATVTAWFESVQSGSKPVRQLINEAIAIRKEMVGDAKEAFVERNSIDGAFILRLVESWATRTDGETVIEDGGDRATMREAIRAVYREKAGQARKDETLVPEEFQRSVDEDPEAQDITDQEEAWEQEYAQSVAPAAPAVAPEEQPVVEDTSTTLFNSLMVSARQMRDYTNLLHMVRSGEGEWPEDLADEGERTDVLKDLDQNYRNVAFMLSDEEIIEHIEASEDENLTWLSENRDILDIGFMEFIRRIEMGEFGDDDEDNADAESAWSTEDPTAPDVPADDEDMPQDAPSREGDDEPVSPFDAVEDEAEQAPIVIGADDGEEGQEIETGDVQKEPIREEIDAGVEAVAAQEDVQPSASEEEAQVGGDVADEVQDEPFSDAQEARTEEPVDVAAQEPMPDLVVAEAADVEVEVHDQGSSSKEEEAPVEVALHEPRDVSVHEVQEMTLAATFVQEWAVASKEAGAVNGAMMRFVSDRSSGAFQPVGLLHLVMLWKGRTGKERSNVVFRWLEEGVWNVDQEVPGKFVRANGDWVGIAPALLAHEEMKASVNIIQIHGPGVTQELLEAAKVWKGLWVVSRTPTSGEVVTKLDT